jgi:EAL domain-containing protein (putative c-di-GMP-specific phosphodiesterase class I)/ActR/RegA family two-component response regulator
MTSPLVSSSDADDMGQPGPSRAPRIAAIVDDESGVRAYLAAVIKKMGLRPMEASCPEEVLTIIERDPNALVLLDLSLGRSDGVLVLEALSARKFTGPILLISGHDQAILDQVNSIGRRLQLTMLPALKKPFKPDALRQIVRDAALLPTEGPIRIDVLNALKQNRAELYYQPKIDLRSLAPIGAEVHVVFNDPTHGVVSEERLTELSQDELAALTKFTLRRAIKDWEKLAADSVVLRLAVDVPTAKLLNGDLIEIVRRERPDDPRWPGLVLDVPERSIPADTSEMQDTLLRLKLHNVDIAIDDVEMKNDNYLKLRNTRLAELKLHRRYADGCATNRDHMTVCRAVVELGGRLKVPVLAQGIETAADQKALERVGYNAGQGNVLAVAGGVAELKRFMRTTYLTQGAAARS